MAAKEKLKIFRGADAKGLMEVMKISPMTPQQKTGLSKLVDAGYLDGDKVRVLVNIPGFCLTYAWLKKDYPLLLHSHSSDCLYYVLAGALQMGTDLLKAGDSILVPAGAAYQYIPGPDGVEVLEFRHETEFDFQNLTKNPAFYEKAAATITANRDAWRIAAPPSFKA